MNKYAVIGIFAGTVLLIIAMAWFGSGGQGQVAPSSGLLEIQQKRYDFGTISMADGNVSYVFKVKNIGDEEVTLTKLFTSCMCTKAELRIGDKKFGPFGMPGHIAVPSIRAVLAPQQTAEIEAVFDPNAHGPAGVGKIERVVNLENNAGAPVVLEFSAMVTP